MANEEESEAVEVPPVAYEMTIRGTVWTLKRAGRVLMRSRDIARVERRMNDLAMREAARTGVEVLCRQHMPMTPPRDDGREACLSFTWTVALARKALATVEAIERMAAETGGGL